MQDQVEIAIANMEVGDLPMTGGPGVLNQILVGFLLAVLGVVGERRRV